MDIDLPEPLHLMLSSSSTAGLQERLQERLDERLGMGGAGPSVELCTASYRLSIDPSWWQVDIQKKEAFIFTNIVSRLWNLIHFWFYFLKACNGWLENQIKSHFIVPEGLKSWNENCPGSTTHNPTYTSKSTMLLTPHPHWNKTHPDDSSKSLHHHQLIFSISSQPPSIQGNSFGFMYWTFSTFFSGS